jgi:hypothetical protein
MPTFIALSLVRGSGQQVAAGRSPLCVARWLMNALSLAVGSHESEARGFIVPVGPPAD